MSATVSRLNNASKITTKGGEKGRIIFLDNLKIALVSLVVVNHASQAYVSINTGWLVNQGDIPAINNALIGPFLSVNNAFFMALFFMISAYFLPASFDRKGASRYLGDRLIRLGLPILFFLFLVFPIVGILITPGQSPTDYLLQTYFNFTDGAFTFGHLWFLGLLLIFSGVYAAYRIAKPGASGNKAKLKVPGNAAILGFTLLLTITLFATRLIFPPGDWQLWHLLEPARLPAYAAMFLVGILAYRNDWMKNTPVSTGKIWGFIAVLTILAAPIIIQVFMGGDDLWAEGFTLAALVLAAWDAFICISLCVCLPVLFREMFDFGGKILKAMANDSFAVYLIHPFVLIALQVMLLSLDLHPFLKFITVSILGVALSFSLGHLIRKIPYVARVV